MFRKFAVTAISAALIAFSPAAFAQQAGGTADEAKAMLLKAVAAVKADKAKAIDMFNKGEAGFLDRDLYVFCANLGDGALVAMGNPDNKYLLGVDLRTLRDWDSKAHGAEIYAAMQKQEGQIADVSYRTQRPGGKAAVAKVALVTRAGDDLGCAVGYYKGASPTPVSTQSTKVADF